VGRGIGFGLLAAVLFGVSAPVAKLLLPSSGPFLLAAILYLGAGLGLLALAPLRRGETARLTKADAAPLAVVIGAGGIVGPVLLMFGLQRVSGVTGSLLLNLEVPLTILIAVLVLREPLSLREAAGGLLVLAGAVALSWQPGAALRGDPAGALAIAGACAAWAIDNNASQKLSLRDPAAVVRWKALPAGAVNLLLAFALGERLPRAAVLGAALATGFVSYGLSLVCNLLAVRHLGAARQAAIFATAPFVGALASVPLLGDRLGAADLWSALSMGAGLALLLRSRHGHRHVHDPVEHEHAHVHDEHHRHEHDAPADEPHTHAHRHERLEHEHPHAPDAHHRHRHD
jgi:drug/metabolite transporter (DMT)-like permease